MLFQTLKELEQRGLIARQVYEVIPPKVDYRLTALGMTFARPIEQMYQWGLENRRHWMRWKLTFARQAARRRKTPPCSVIRQ